MAFVKLDCGLLDSTLWADREGREMFITGLLMARPVEINEPTPTIQIRSLEPGDYTIPPGWYGLVEAASTGIARRANIENEAGLSALERLAAPEPESRTPDHEGRRMVRVNGGFIILNYDSYRRKDHTAADRSRRYRQRNTQKLSNNDPNVTASRVTSRSVTQAEAEAEAYTEKKEREGAPLLLEVREVFEAWNGMAARVSLPQCLVLSDKRRRTLGVRLNEPYFKANWRAAMDKVCGSQFCLGGNERGWRASFDWFITPDAVARLLEGKYDGKTGPAKPQPKTLLEKIADSL